MFKKNNNSNNNSQRGRCEGYSEIASKRTEPRGGVRARTTFARASVERKKKRNNERASESERTKKNNKLKKNQPPNAGESTSALVFGRAKGRGRGQEHEEDFANKTSEVRGHARQGRVRKNKTKQKNLCKKKLKKLKTKNSGLSEAKLERYEGQPSPRRWAARNASTEKTARPRKSRRTRKQPKKRKRESILVHGS